MEPQLGLLFEIRPFKSGQEVTVSLEPSRVGAPYARAGGVSSYATNAQSLAPQLGFLSELGPVEAGQEVAVSRDRKVPVARDGGRSKVPKGGPCTRRPEPLGPPGPEIGPVTRGRLLDKKARISERGGPSGSPFRVSGAPHGPSRTPPPRAPGTFPSEAPPDPSGPFSPGPGGPGARGRALCEGPTGTVLLTRAWCLWAAGSPSYGRSNSGPFSGSENSSKSENVRSVGTSRAPEALTARPRKVHRPRARPGGPTPPGSPPGDMGGKRRWENVKVYKTSLFSRYLENQKAKKFQTRVVRRSRGALSKEATRVPEGLGVRELRPVKGAAFSAYISRTPGPIFPKL